MTHAETASLSQKWLRKHHDALTATERKILEAVHERRHVSRAPPSRDDRTFGERLADRVAEFGGSWTFILLFALFLAAWVLLNTAIALRVFDPYPFIFLNLILSMLAAVQAPIIMMSQNRQAKKDRENAEHDYAVNLKAELEIMGLHEKLDELRTAELTRLMEYQQQQMEILLKLAEGRV